MRPLTGPQDLPCQPRRCGHWRGSAVGCGPWHNLSRLGILHPRRRPTSQGSSTPGASSHQVHGGSGPEWGRR
eukprot:1133703-Lingulodinium_polyedra.AAC.1